MTKIKEVQVMVEANNNFKEAILNSDLPREDKLIAMDASLGMDEQLAEMDKLINGLPSKAIVVESKALPISKSIQFTKKPRLNHSTISNNQIIDAAIKLRRDKTPCNRTSLANAIGITVKQCDLLTFNRGLRASRLSPLSIKKLEELKKK